MDSLAEQVKQQHLAEACGPQSPLLDTRTIDEVLNEIALRYPQRRAVKVNSEALTYRELNDAANSLAASLTNLGLQRGERLAVSLGNCVAFIVLMYATAKIGVIFVPLNPAYNNEQLQNTLNHVGVSCLVINTHREQLSGPPRSNASTLDSLIHTNEVHDRTYSTISTLNLIILVGNGPVQDFLSYQQACYDYNELLKRSVGHKPPLLRLNCNDPIHLQFTSGTTSSPKAVCLTHYNVMNNGRMVAYSMELTHEDVICCAPPQFHVFGTVLGLLAALAHGSCVVWCGERFRPTAVLDCILSEKITVLHGIPTMFIAEMNALTEAYRDAIKNVRLGLLGGSPVTQSLRARLRSEFKRTKFVNAYGMTETSSAVCMTSIEDQDEYKGSTVGRPFPHISARIVARDDPTKTLRRGERGELLIRGYAVMPGYWYDPITTRANQYCEPTHPSQGTNDITHTWMRTGDEAVMDLEGYITITGRVKDIIIRGGENIYPLEIENVILCNPEIADVAVVGLPDDLYGEVVAAFMVLRLSSLTVENHARNLNCSPISSTQQTQTSTRAAGHGIGQIRQISDTEGVIQWAKSRLPSIQVPKYFFQISALPLTASGKVEKFTLRSKGTNWLNQAQSDI